MFTSGGNNKMFKKISVNLILSLVLFSVAALGCSAQETAKNDHSSAAAAEDSFSMDKFPDVVATVNKVAITKLKLQRTYAMLLSRSRMEKRKLTNKELLDSSLNELINIELLKQESADKKVEAASEDVEKELDKIKAQFHKPGEFEKAMKKNDISIDTIKNDIKTRLAINKLLEMELGNKKVATEKDIKTFYDNNPNFFKTQESVKASHILIKVAPESDEESIAEARKKAEDILAKAKSGKNFGELAKKYSEGPSASNEGDLGFFIRGQMVKPFEDAAFSLKNGEISDIVSSRFGFHIIKVFDHKKEGTTPYDEVRDSIAQYLTKLGREKFMVDYVNSLRSKAAIEKNI